MSSRVNESREAQRQEQARLQQKIQQEKKGTSEDFKKLVASGQEQTSKATQTQAKQSGARQSAHNMLLARQGIRGNQFASMLQKQGEQHVQTGGQDAKGRAEQLRDDKANTQEADGKMLRAKENQEDPLAAISREAGGGSGGKGDSDGAGDMGGGHEPSQFMGDGIGAASHTESAQAAQGARGPQIPPHVLQEIVRRVMVGVNEEGLSEFHIEFRQDILAGSSLRLRAKDGKINAKFYSRDKNVGRLIKASEGELARAFASKGLTLEPIEVETT